MKRYEGLFILRNPAKEEGLKDVIDAIQKQIETAGGKVETVQKMDKRSFVRVANKKDSSGFYVNFIFLAPAPTVTAIRSFYRMSEEVMRVLITAAPQLKEPAAA